MCAGLLQCCICWHLHSPADPTHPAQPQIKRRQPALGPTNAIRRSLLRAKQAEADSLRGVLVQVQVQNAELEGQLAERRRQAQELLAKAQVGWEAFI